VPSEKNDIRLGDVAVSTALETSGGVVEYDLGKQTPTGFEKKGSLCPPPTESNIPEVPCFRPPV